MNKNTVKRIFVIILLFLILLSNIAFANNFDTSDYNSISTTEDDDLINFTQKIMGTGLKIVRIVAAGVAIIGIIFTGIKYMTSSPEGRASYKKSLILFVLGLVLVIAGTTIIDIIASTFSE